MSELLPNAFIGKAEMPTDEDLAAALGSSAQANWNQLLASLAEQHHLVIREWNSYSLKAGWSMRLKLAKRNIVYLVPCKGCFRASFALGDRAVKAARESGLPKRVLKIIDEAKRYVEGTAVPIEVRGPQDIAVVTKLAAIKLAN